MSYESVILDEQQYGGLPVAYHALDEVAGTAAVDLMTRVRGSSNDGTYVGTPTLDARPGPISREPGGWPLLNGTTQRVTTSVLGTMGSNVAAGLSIEAWLTTTDSAAIRCIGGVSNDGSGHMYLNLVYNLDQNGSITANRLYGVLKDNTATPKSLIAAATATYADGKPHHIVATFLASSNAIIFYCDGVPLTTSYSSQGTPVSFANWTSAWTWGATNYGGTFYYHQSGNLGRCAIYNYVLAAARVKAHYLAGINGTPNPRRLAG